MNLVVEFRYTLNFRNKLRGTFVARITGVSINPGNSFITSFRGIAMRSCSTEGDSYSRPRTFAAAFDFSLQFVDSRCQLLPLLLARLSGASSPTLGGRKLGLLGYIASFSYWPARNPD